MQVIVSLNEQLKAVTEDKKALESTIEQLKAEQTLSKN